MAIGDEEYAPFTTEGAGAYTRPETKIPEPPGFWRNQFDTGIDITRGILGVGRAAQGIDEGVLSAIDPNSPATMRARRGMAATQAADEILRGWKSPYRQHEEAEGGPSWSNDKLGYARDLAVGILPWVPVAMATGVWGAVPTFMAASFGSQRADQKARIDNMTDEEKKQNSQYMSAIQSGMTDREAKDAIYQQTMDPRRLQTWQDMAPGIIGEGVGGGMGGLMTKAFMRTRADKIVQAGLDVANKTWMRRRASGFAAGASGGFAEGMGTDVSQQMSARSAGLGPETIDYGRSAETGLEYGTAFGALGMLLHRKPRVPSVGTDVEATAREMMRDHERPGVEGGYDWGHTTDLPPPGGRGGPEWPPGPLPDPGVGYPAGSDPTEPGPYEFPEIEPYDPRFGGGYPGTEAEVGPEPLQGGATHPYPPPFTSPQPKRYRGRDPKKRAEYREDLRQWQEAKARHGMLGERSLEDIGAAPGQPATYWIGTPEEINLPSWSPQAPSADPEQQVWGNYAPVDERALVTPHKDAFETGGTSMSSFAIDEDGAIYLLPDGHADHVDRLREARALPDLGFSDPRQLLHGPSGKPFVHITSYMFGRGGLSVGVERSDGISKAQAAVIRKLKNTVGRIRRERGEKWGSFNEEVTSAEIPYRGAPPVGGWDEDVRPSDQPTAKPEGPPVPGKPFEGPPVVTPEAPAELQALDYEAPDIYDLGTSFPSEPHEVPAPLNDRKAIERQLANKSPQTRGYMAAQLLDMLRQRIKPTLEAFPGAKAMFGPLYNRIENHLLNVSPTTTIASIRGRDTREIPGTGVMDADDRTKVQAFIDTIPEDQRAAEGEWLEKAALATNNRVRTAMLPPHLQTTAPWDVVELIWAHPGEIGAMMQGKKFVPEPTRYYTGEPPKGEKVPPWMEPEAEAGTGPQATEETRTEETEDYYGLIPETEAKVPFYPKRKEAGEEPQRTKAGRLPSEILTASRDLKKSKYAGLEALKDRIAGIKARRERIEGLSKSNPRERPDQRAQPAGRANGTADTGRFAAPAGSTSWETRCTT